MNSTDTKKPTGRQALVPWLDQALTTTRQKRYLAGAKLQDGKNNTTISFYCTVRYPTYSHLFIRRSFHTARQSCDINLSRPDQPITFNTRKSDRPLGAGQTALGDNNRRSRRGAVLPAVVQMVADYRSDGNNKSVGVTNSPSLDRLWGVEL